MHYVLSERLRFHGNPDGMAVFDHIAEALRRDLGLNSRPSPSAFVRIPATPNMKPGGRRDAPIVLSELDRKYSIETLLAFAARTVSDYASLHPEVTAGDEPTTLSKLDIVALRTRLPAKVLATLDENPTSERSEHFHGRVALLYRHDLVEGEITALMRHHPVAHRYGKYLSREVARCLEKIRRDEAKTHALLEPLRTPGIIDPRLLRPLSVETGRMAEDYFARYCDGIPQEKRDEILATARFVEDRVFRMQETRQGSAIDEDPGQGKPVGAICHIAAHARPGRQYALALESLDKLDQAAEAIRQLNPALTVGTYHGWREDECHTLSGREHKAYQTAPRSEDGKLAPACRMCPGRADCAHHNREDALSADAVVTTHESLRRLLSANRLKDRRLIIDEAPSLYRSERF